MRTDDEPFAGFGAPEPHQPVQSIDLDDLPSEPMPPMIPRTLAESLASGGTGGLAPASSHSHGHEPEKVAYETGQALLGSEKPGLPEWSHIGRLVEACALGLTLLLLLVGLLGGEWCFGVDEAHRLVRAGLSSRTVGGVATKSLRDDCDADGKLSASCALSSAGASAGSYGWAALTFAMLVGLCLAAEELDRRALLNTVRAKLPPNFPTSRLELVRPVAWGLLLLLTYAALVAYAALAPTSLGGGFDRLGWSYGAVRLALVVALAGLGAHLSLVWRLGEHAVVGAFDALRRSWARMSRHQRACQLLLGAALAAELLLWARRVDWGFVVVIYGVWAQVHDYADHLAAFCCAAVFSVMADALRVAHDPGAGVLTPLLLSLLLVCKMGAVGLLVYTRDAFP